MKNYIAALCGGALVIAAASIGYAQPGNPPGTDRKAGESSTQSSQPNPDKGSKGQPNRGTTGSGPVTVNPTPGTDSPGSESSTDSAKKKQR